MHVLARVAKRKERQRIGGLFSFFLFLEYRTVVCAYGIGDRREWTHSCTPREKKITFRV